MVNVGASALIRTRKEEERAGVYLQGASQTWTPFQAWRAASGRTPGNGARSAAAELLLTQIQHLQTARSTEEWESWYCCSCWKRLPSAVAKAQSKTSFGLRQYEWVLVILPKVNTVRRALCLSELSR